MTQHASGVGVQDEAVIGYEWLKHFFLRTQHHTRSVIFVIFLFPLSLFFIRVNLLPLFHFSNLLHYYYTHYNKLWEKAMTLSSGFTKPTTFLLYHYSLLLTCQINTVIAAFVLVFGLFSFVVKERIFLADSLVAMLWGIAGISNISNKFPVGPKAMNVVDPSLWGTDIQLIVFYFSDLVINIQVSNRSLNIQIMAAAISLPRRFWKTRWKSLAILLGPVTVYMWLSTAVVFHFFIGLDWFPALLLASTCAPTGIIIIHIFITQQIRCWRILS
jgi:hypothetical protein